jgi:F-type H+-transporting ATPase subunit epsilon
MAKFHFSLVAPERELFSGEVDQVDAFGIEGDFGVLAGHEPFMTVLRPGLVKVRIDETILAYQVDGGFADVTPESFTLLAEHAVEDKNMGRVESSPLVH